MLSKASLFLACGLTLAMIGGHGFAADQPDYHATAPGAAIAPYVVPEATQPHLSSDQLWALLRRRVKYVFVLYQENRSFDSFFGTFPGVDGLFSRPPDKTAGLYQPLLNCDGSAGVIHPFRIGPEQFAADTDDVDHSHRGIVLKMNVVDAHPQMDRFALIEQQKHSPTTQPTLQARQFGELTMAYEDGDTIPLLWRYADRFVLCDHIFQLMTGPLTPGNLSIIAAQSGQTQWLLHPDQAPQPGKSKGVPVLNDDSPLGGSPLDHVADGMPVNPTRRASSNTQQNLTFASLPLTLQGKTLKPTTQEDADPDDDLEDVGQDITAITQTGKPAVSFGWYQEGYDHEPIDPGPTDAEGRHASYVTHHNGPQYFGYVAHNPRMRRNLHGLEDFFEDLRREALPDSGGVFYIKGGYENIMGLKPTDPDPAVQHNFIGDDDHPAYSDAQISEALVATAINRIAASRYWSQCAIILTWDDSEGDYDHVPPPIRAIGPDGLPLSDGPRVPLLVISPFARVHYVCHATGNHASVVKFVDSLFDLIPLARLPDELRARQIGQKQYGQADLGPADAISPDVTDLLETFDPARLSGAAALLPAEYVTIPEELVKTLPGVSSYGCRDLGITPVDRLLSIKNEIPPDFNPAPRQIPRDNALADRHEAIDRDDPPNA